MASHTLSSELYMKKILAGTSASVLMAGGLLVATASAPAQADPYGPTLYTFCDISGVSTSAGQKVVFKLRVSSNSVSGWSRSEEHTSELQSLMRISYAVFCLKTKKKGEKDIVKEG